MVDCVTFLGRARTTQKRTAEKIKFSCQILLLHEIFFLFLSLFLLGEILIAQECNIVTAPAPPLIVRQQPPRARTPQPLVIREAPPRPPAPTCRQVITISGKRLPPPPRKVVLERLAPMPVKPQAVLVERWLPYAPQKRRVIFKPPCSAPDADLLVEKIDKVFETLDLDEFKKALFVNLI